jgi:hypothetical protein
MNGYKNIYGGIKTCIVINVKKQGKEKDAPL